MTGHPLDNLVWHALQGPHRHLARASGDGRAVRYDPDVSPFCAVDRFDEGGWAGLADLVGPGGIALLFRDEVPEPPRGWDVLHHEACTQFVAGDLGEPPDLPLVELGPANADEMLALAKLTEPGPFGPRTGETGTYLGIREGGELIAMAGQRLRADGWGEVSGVCVHPRARRRGLGGALTLAVAADIRATGSEAMLHVREGNDAALALYDALGFEVRRMIVAGVVRPGS